MHQKNVLTIKESLKKSLIFLDLQIFNSYSWIPSWPNTCLTHHYNIFLMEAILQGIFHIR